MDDSNRMATGALEVDSASEAACVAVVGPANAGKTTLLHQLDEKLSRLDSFLVLKGNPDGTGRYLYHAPELRNEPELKRSVKGKWGDATIDRICEWITHGRRNLSLALLDFGGRNDEQTAEGNARMLRVCSHYLVVSRDGDAAGAALWDSVCRGLGLKRLGWMRSVLPDGSLPVVLDSEEGIHARFRVDIRPGDPINDAAIAPLVDALLRLSSHPNQTAYVNLHKPGDWSIDQISGVGGQALKIAELASRTGVVVLGGKAPIWAYLAGLRCAMEARSDARIFFFDPKQPERLVEIPAGPRSPCDAPAAFPDVLHLFWREDGARSVLQFEITTPDKFLPPSAAQNLAGAPPPPPAPSPEMALFGAGPTWLYGTYARWMIAGGARSVASWDGRTRSFIQIWG